MLLSRALRNRVRSDLQYVLHGASGGLDDDALARVS